MKYWKCESGHLISIYDTIKIFLLFGDSLKIIKTDFQTCINHIWRDVWSDTVANVIFLPNLLFHIGTWPNFPWPDFPWPNFPWSNLPWPNFPWPYFPWPLFPHTIRNYSFEKQLLKILFNHCF